MTIEEAITYFDARRNYNPHNGNPEAERIALDALRAQQKAEKNEPLTLAELREMDGEPVWIVEYPDWGHWELAADAEDYLVDREEAFYGMKHNDPLGVNGLHKLGWLAYRRKPEEVQE